MTCQTPQFPIPQFPWLTQYTPVIPKLYWDVYSQEERIKWICKEWDRIIHYLKDICIQTNNNTVKIEELQELFKKFMESGFNDYYEKQIQEWINKNFQNIIEYAIQVLFFGLTEDGYFCAYVPNNWAKYITFDTGAVYNADDYGRLIIRY